MKTLTNVSVEYTGGNNWVYQAMYKGKYWLYGNLSGCLSAYSYEPFKYMDENNCGNAPEEYAVIDATDFPTWGSVLRSIIDLGYNRQYILDEMMYWNTGLRLHVNEEEIETDASKTLAELITENHLERFSDLEFDWFDDPLGVVFIPFRDYAIMARSRWVKKAETLTLIAEYAIYHAKHTWDESIKIMNDLRYDATYTLVSVCSETFENIAIAICHATASLYMKGSE